VERVLERLSETPSILTYQAAVQGLQRAYPDRMQIECYGQSSGGRALYRLRLRPWDPELARVHQGQPVLVLAADLEAPPDPVRLLRWFSELAQFDNGIVSAELVFYPMPDPDGWVGNPGGTAARVPVQLNRNFSAGWVPWSTGEGNPGSLPLSEPETHALAKSLHEMPEAVGLLVLASEAEPNRPAQAPGGSLELHAQEILGLTVTHGAGPGPSAWQTALVRAETLRPKLGMERVECTRLSQQLCLVEVQLHATGAAIPAGDSIPLAMRVSGASCVKWAWARAEADRFVEGVGESLPGLPAPQEPLRLRLVVRVVEGQTPVLHMDSPRLNGVRLALPLDSKGS
jgi:hypothetical protein